MCIYGIGVFKREATKNKRQQKILMCVKACAYRPFTSPYRSYSSQRPLGGGGIPLGGIIIPGGKLPWKPAHIYRRLLVCVCLNDELV